MLRLLAIGLAIVGVTGFLIRKSGGEDIAQEVADAIANSLTTISTTFADAVRTLVHAIVLPITIPAEAFARALELFDEIGGPIAVAGFVTLYFYLVTTPLTKSKPNPRIVGYLLVFVLFGIVLNRLRKTVMSL